MTATIEPEESRYCFAENWAGATCELLRGHDGDHEGGLNSEYYTWENYKEE